MKKSFLGISVVLLLVVLLSFVSERQDENLVRTVHEYPVDGRSLCDAPLISAGWTSAPGDGSCANSGCHSGGINNGPGFTYFTVGSGDNVYTPGETYTIALGIEQSAVNKFGFQVTTLRADNDQVTGQNALSEPARTRLIQGSNYVGTNACGSDADPAGMIDWTYQWTAPSTDVGEIVFYSNFLATNHNHSGSGDNTYSMAISVFPSNPNAVNELEVASFSVYPNPARDFIRIDGACESAEILEYTLYDITGNQVRTGAMDCTLDIKDLDSGSYLLHTKEGEHMGISRFVVLK